MVPFSVTLNTPLCTFCIAFLISGMRKMAVSNLCEKQFMQRRHVRITWLFNFGPPSYLWNWWCFGTHDLYVCVCIDRTDVCAKMAEPIDLPFGGLTCVGSNHCVKWGSRLDESICSHKAWQFGNLGTRVSCAKTGEPIEVLFGGGAASWLQRTMYEMGCRSDESICSHKE